MDQVVVVGASLAGVRAAETLRAEGFTGALTVVGAEPHRPYDRPPLSKQVLTEGWDAEHHALKAGVEGALDVDWRLGVQATALDLAEHRVELSSGEALGFDGLVIATGARARPLPGTARLAGVHALRTLDDARAIRTALDRPGGPDRPVRVVVVGAGFIGCEVAAAARARGAEVTIVEPLEQPLVRVLGAQVGAVVADLHRHNGVDLRLGVGVAEVVGGDRVTAVSLADGTELPADLVVVGIGVVPETDWLVGSGLTIDDGVVCDETTLAAPGVVACGDVARWPNRRFDEVARVEHWEHALDMATHAARRLLATDEAGAAMAYEPVPWFWSDQYDRKIQLAGRARPDDRLVVVAGSLADRRFTALYGRGDRVVGALGMNMPAKVVRYRPAIAEGLGWDDALAAAAAPG